jgi:hypothetical protein
LQCIQIKNNDFIYCLGILSKIFWIFKKEYFIQTENKIYYLQFIYELDISTKKPPVESLFFAILELT